ncbi:MAG TPA: LCP family protein [Candidatus Limnocylindrales bacterium]|nr:LCP family protein [Candidatus Limnocylindrales bacterium]
MQPSLATLRAAPPRRIAVVALVVGLILAVVAAGSLVLAQRPGPAVAVASPTPTPRPTATPSPPPTPRPTATPAPSPTPTPAPSVVLGSDGRLTVLLLGSDYRPSKPGNRTDVIMVVSIDPTSGAVAAASIPRDTTNFPTSSRRVYAAKVNGLYQSLIGQMGQPKAAAEMKRIVGSAIGVEVDAYAVIGFEGVRRLVDAVGGVDVTLAKAVSDPYYWVTPRKRGVYFRAGTNHLDGQTALIFARTRKADNDFERARRQQLLVAGALDAVRTRGLENLPKLVRSATKWVKTDLPVTAAPALFEMFSKADLAGAHRIVFGPRTWATSTGGSSFALKLDAVRGWTAKWMAPVPSAAASSPPPGVTP